MTLRKIEGIITALVTPLTREGALDHAALENLVEHQLEAGVAALFVNGSVGEGPMMPEALYLECAKRVIDQAAGRAVILGGAIDNSLARCLERINILAELGADAAVATLPYYGWPCDEARSLGFFRALARAAALPLIAYNLPKVTGWSLSLPGMEALLADKQLAGIKDTRGDLEEMILLATHRRPEHLGYYPGNSALALPLLKSGADGLVSTPANLLPELYVALYRAIRLGNLDKAARLDAANQELVKILTMPSGPAGIKAVLQALGRGTAACLPPWPEASDSELTATRASYEAALKLWREAERE